MTIDWLWDTQWWQTLQDNAWNSTVTHVFVVLAIAGLVDFIARRFIHRVEVHVASKTDNPWDDAFLVALRTPLSLLIWAIGLRVASLLIDDPVFQDERAQHLFFVSVVAISVWFFVRWISRTEIAVIDLSKKKRLPDDRLDPTTVHALGRLIRLAIIITGVLVSLDTFQIDISAVLAFGGIGGIAIGFAAKDLLANFFGGLTVYLDQPFKVGDWIRSPDREIEGTVEYIGWRQTRIRTFDKRPLYVPNAVFTTVIIENPQRMLNRRIYETIGVRYDDIAKMSVITADVENMLRTHPEIDTNQLLMVYFNAFASSSCDFFVYTFTKTTNWSYYHKVKHDVLLLIAGIIESHGAEIAYPTSTLHIASAPEPPDPEERKS